jgi:glycosyltransferase involved in cell wall biosynthesis
MIKHFVYHHRTAGRGAEGLHIMNLVRSLETASHSVTIASPPGVDPRLSAGAVPLDKNSGRQRGVSALWKWISCRCPQVLFESIEVIYNLFAMARLWPLLRSLRPQAYYERYAFFLFAGVWTARRFRLPVVLEVNEVAGLARARRQVLVRLATLIERFVFRRADKLIVVSSTLRDQVIERGARPEAVVLMPNAIDARRFDLTACGIPVREKFAMGHDTVIGFVGWFDVWDRLESLVDAFAALRRAQPATRLMLVGDGPVAGRLRERIACHKLGENVILTGPVRRDEVPRYIAAMDICVLPDSNNYGSPMVLFEFMAMAKAIVAADLPPIRDVVQNGETGLLVERGNSGAIEQAIRLLADNPQLRERLGRQARQAVMEDHNWETNARRVVELAEGLVERQAEWVA